MSGVEVKRDRHAYQPGTNGSGSSGNMCTTKGIRMPSSFAEAKTFIGSLPAATKRSPSTATH